MHTTNVKPWQLNYDRYSQQKYDRDIVAAIPYHREIHEKIGKFILSHFSPKKTYRVLDLGVGTGITSKLIQDLLPRISLDVIDFSSHMLKGAQKKLGHKNVTYIRGDYATKQFSHGYDMVVSVIGLHHQNDLGKKRLFKKIFAALKPCGYFIFGDLVTYANPRQAARNNARHYHHLVKHARNEKTLTEWAYHHMFLNDIATIEDQTKWLTDAGFKVRKEFLKMNTALLCCLKR